ncbi:hypothetical protein AB6806_09050 [Bosea sp. RCC_152_1]|uniref:hypothetical protein n=1 Tax=Bosea sp. RCC_152_1 TaxID=3239228 RepID=UPI003525876F
MIVLAALARHLSPSGTVLPLTDIETTSPAMLSMYAMMALQTVPTTNETVAHSRALLSLVLDKLRPELDGEKSPLASDLKGLHLLLAECRNALEPLSVAYNAQKPATDDATRLLYCLDAMTELARRRAGEAASALAALFLPSSSACPHPEL